MDNLRDLDTLDIAVRTEATPFCAGVVVTRGASLLVTLNTDHLPPHLANGTTWRVGGVGGGQEAGESLVACALREAHEELSTQVVLRSSPLTYFEDLDLGSRRRVHCITHPAPLLVQRRRNATPDRPFRDGLPIGPYLHVGLFLAHDPGDSAPGDDVSALLFLPLECWPLLATTPSLQALLEHGARLISTQDPDPAVQRLWVAPDESFHSVVALLLEHPQLLEEARR
jgi:8-oxo-dGTP pyrophosphatase MutT (NUDIX family)